MAIPTAFDGRLSLPLVAAPMFLVSGPELVIETCKAGVIGTFPALNERTSEGFEQWLNQIEGALAEHDANHPTPSAPFGVNLIVHQTNPRLRQDLELIVKHRVPMVITSLGAVREVVDAVHSYGGLVFHDVTNIRHARKAAEAGVDGLIAVCAGAGGHAGTLSPFALINEIRQFFTGTVLLSGCLSSGRDIATARMLGADLAYAGTRFINTRESRASDGYKQMITECSASDIVYTPKISGIPANFLKPSLAEAGIDSDSAGTKEVDLGKELTAPKEGARAWKTIWSAGQGVGSIHDLPHTAELIQRMRREFSDAVNGFNRDNAGYLE
ncbi:Dioxygenases related to 2-nitropropane dioxygenase [Marinobacterium lacunae]|uniref:Dioxygenases related to 2-nitropropane dioxygenase n=1 Tax=Marinobacterium lacunae TaxID=1232683 RepID=A0A081FZL6_9GAMM|nr:nitronate monooxygenase family protein [Marinobacterium lacunae]KEA63971.1 Dioxygenases related to 2-nitropropane dioxygenase [Marinobacterium lacunae]